MSADKDKATHGKRPYAGLSNRELIWLFIKYVKLWALNLFPQVSDTEDSDRYCGIQIKERLGTRSKKIGGERRVLIAARRIPIIVAGYRISYVGLIIIFFIVVIIAVLVKRFFS